MRTDLGQRVIIATTQFDSGPALLLVDGVHRMYRAMTERIQALPAQVLTVAQTAKTGGH